MRAIRSICSTLAALLLLSAVPAANGELPRYDLPVGRKLTWSIDTLTRNQPPATNEQERTTGSLQATVLRENGDGSRRIVFRSATTLLETPRGERPRARPPHVRLSYADLFPDGRMLPNATITAASYPSIVFPQLPADAAEQSGQWVRDNTTTLERFEYKRETDAGRGGGDADAFVFTAVDNGVMMKIYQTTLTHTFRFDRRRGVVVDIDSRRTQTYGYHMTSTGRLKLESEQTIPAGEIPALAAEYDRLFDAQHAYGVKLGAAEHDPTHADAHLADAEAVISRAAAEAETELVRSELQTILNAHARNAKYVEDRADRLKEVLNRPAADWQTTDIDGKPVKLADFRGKVVVLDFWYRMCGYCLMAMPQVKQLAADYKDKPVVILGMNTDADVNDARFVIETFALTYPTIRAEGIWEAYGVVGFPALFIVDQNGIVRSVHVGYNADLRDKVSRDIDQLLAEAETAGGAP